MWFGPGGEVWVQGGTYEERITLHPYAYLYGGFAGYETVRAERNWDANLTTLDGQQEGSVVTARAGCAAVGAIDGFTITNGSGTVFGSYTRGGGLYLGWSFPTIANNTITGNEAGDYGGGLCLYSSSPTIVNNTITDNIAAVYGGGLCLLLEASPTTIANNTISGNSAGSGGALYLYGSSPTIANNTIKGNIADGGGGLYLAFSSPAIENNTITGNSADEYGGGGLYLYDYSSPTIANTIVAFNSSGIRQDQYYAGTPTLRYNCVCSNTEYDYEGLSDPTGTNGNIDDDPVFVDPGYWDDNGTPGDPDDGFWVDGDYHLQADSPCINTGDNEAVPPQVTTDLDGHARILCDRVDMGAYEFGIGDYDCDQTVDLTDFAAWEACMTGPDNGPYDSGCEAFDFEFDGDVDLHDFALFQVFFKGPQP